MVFSVRRDPPFAEPHLILHSLCKLDPPNLLRTGWSVVEDVAILEREGCVRLAALDDGVASVAGSDQASVEGGIHAAVIVNSDDATHTRNLAPPDHREQVSAAPDEFVIARESIEEQIIAAGIVFDTGVPYCHGEAAGSRCSA